MKNQWYTYILLCNDKTLYTGITTDILRRIKEHNTEAKGAKYTKSRRPVRLFYHEQFKSRQDAARREHQIKKMTRTEKQNLPNTNGQTEQIDFNKAIVSH
jgi:putative endonuclease